MSGSVGSPDPTTSRAGTTTPRPDAADRRFDRHPSTTGHGRPADNACSVLSDGDATSAYGTAAPARFFVLLEQGGPWGRDAARQSHLDPVLGRELESRCTRAGGRFMLIRRPVGHPDHYAPRKAVVAFAGPKANEAWLLQATLPTPGRLLALDWPALSQGDQAAVAASLPDAHPVPPALLVCTNGRRDVCCAVRGRPIAAAAHLEAPDRVWEVSHTGGHRFAPTAVLLPWGQNYARLDEASTRMLLTTSLTGRTPPPLLGAQHDRGRSGLAPAEQCAESFVRAHLLETRIDAFTTGAPMTPGEPVIEPVQTASAGPERAEGKEIEVVHSDGRRFTVHVERVASGPVRPGSCGKAAIPVLEHRARFVHSP